MPKLTCENLAKRFGRRLVFREMSFCLEGGRTLAVTGANGSGKTTLLRILAGVLRPTAGRVGLEVSGSSVSAVRRPLCTGLVAPALGVYDGLTARENLAFLARARGLKAASSRIETLLAEVGLAGRADEPVRAYSSGMKQRVKYAAALLAEPPLLLLDEPSANLDAAGRTMVDHVVERHRAREGLLVLATNDPQEAARCDETLCVEDFA